MSTSSGWTSVAEMGRFDGGSTEKLRVVRLDPARLKRSRAKTVGICLLAILAVLVTAGVVVGVLVAKKVIHVGSATSSNSVTNASPDITAVTSSAGVLSPQATATTNATAATATTSGSPKPTSCSTSDSIPASVKGTYMDITSWLDLTDFNCTFTDEKVGGLPLVGLNSTWDDSMQANPHVPALNKPWNSYGSRPIRGVNLGGWLSLEPFITPSLFDAGSPPAVDEYTLCELMGSKAAAAALEKHYSNFITEDDFKSIANAGLDHVRIPFSYWAVKTYDNDPYVLGVSWRYLLRGIEWARKYGIRVNLDLHAVPGSQNGWNHSGRQGTVGWLQGPNGTINGQRSLDIHDQLSKFFAQPRYKNIVAFYGLVNEPAKELSQDALVNWTAQAYKIVRGNGVHAPQIFSDALRGLPAWQGKLTGYGNNLVVDSHEYTLFDDNLIDLKHTAKVSFACDTYTAQLAVSMDKSSGFGPTMVGEWSQADTDCAKYVNGVGNGARWNGSFSDTGGSPKCPTRDSQCNCEMANADPSNFTSDYKTFLSTWAVSQMSTFEKTWGWFYWTWKTESAPLWSYKAGLQGGFMPLLAYERDWNCSQPIPSFGSLPEFY